MTSTTETTQRPETKASAKVSSSDSLADRAKEQAAQAVQTAQEHLDAGMKYSSGELQRFADQTQDFVKKNPGLALAGALGAGILLGLAMRRRY